MAYYSLLSRTLNKPNEIRKLKNLPKNFEMHIYRL